MVGCDPVQSNLSAIGSLLLPDNLSLAASTCGSLCLRAQRDLAACRSPACMFMYACMFAFMYADMHACPCLCLRIRMRIGIYIGYIYIYTPIYECTCFMQLYMHMCLHTTYKHHFAWYTAKLSHPVETVGIALWLSFLCFWERL